MRNQNFWTYFMRNRPEMELITSLIQQKKDQGPVMVAVVACSRGAEVYSLLWCLQQKNNKVQVKFNAIDISDDIVKLAEKGEYSIDSPIFERLTDDEIQGMFDRSNDSLKIKAGLKKGISWHVGDACSEKMLHILSQHDVVVANRFLCHMYPEDAETCLINVSKLVKPGGYLFVSGIDLDVRKKVALKHQWEPVFDMMEQIHEGDYTLRRGWPLAYYGLEPMDKHRKDWPIRYASVFRMPDNHAVITHG